MTTSNQTEVTVSVDDGHLDQVEEVAERLRAAGMEVSRTLPRIGTITGSVETKKLEALRNVAGVAAVEVGRVFQLPPPDSPIQ